MDLTYPGLRSLVKHFSRYYLRHGRLFKKYLQQLENTEKYSTAELEQYKNEKLRAVIKLAYENVPFYRECFRERKLKPGDIKTTEDLQKLPYIDKHIVQKKLSNFKNRNFKGFVTTGYTTGTSGTSGAFLRDLSTINFENAALWRQYQLMGKPLGSKRVTLRGELICPTEQTKPPFWRIDPFSKELVLSSFHLSDKTIRQFAQKILNFSAYDLYTYPSTGYQLATLCNQFDIKIKFKNVFTSSEMSWEHQSSAMEEVFGTQVYDWYGSAERVAAIGHCEYKVYHEISDYSVTEYLQVGDARYEVVGTTLFNSVMPLIRYRTGDLVTLGEDTQCDCGRNFRRIGKILGRNDDLILLEDGRKIAILGTIFKGINFMKEAQIVQHAVGDIELKVAPLRPLGAKDYQSLKERLFGYIGTKGIRYRINTVDCIHRGNGDKYKFIKSHIDESTAFRGL